MNSTTSIITWLNTNAGILSIIVAILIAVIPAIWTFINFLILKNKELRHERFKIYHQLIESLIQPNASGQGPFLDRQIAIIYEFRNFQEYFVLTKRMLEGLKKNWGDHPNFKRLTDEIDLTLQFIENKSNH